MYKYLLPPILLGIVFLLIGNACQPTAQTEQTQSTSPPKPNIIYILADDLGYGDLSIFGQQRFQTPHLDALAKGGLRLTQHYAGTTVCAPSRSSLMTGLHTGHTPIRGNKRTPPEGQQPLPDASITIAEKLKQGGYVTGAFGKWGLGGPGSEGAPENQGFDTFFGYLCQTLAHNYYPYHLWDNQKKLMLDENEGHQEGIYAPNLIHEEALTFIEANKDTNFFLYYPSVIPHAELFAPEAYMEKHRGKYDPEKSFTGRDEGERFRLGPYGSQPEGHAAFAAMVNLLDDQVGEIRARLETLGIAENTLIIFSSDNGPHLEAGADPDYFDSNGPMKGYKRDLYEGGIRVPTIAYWPGTVAAGESNNHLSAFWDLYPTLCELAGVPIESDLDGLSFLPTLLGEEQPQHDYLYWEFHEKGGRQAVRKGKWKAVKYDIFKDPQRKIELYDIAEDIGEENDLAADHPEIVEEMAKIMLDAREESTVFPFEARIKLE
ncbi:MAG: arylsulfatase [Saprospiraceae bacterium]|nr:arylsulfatase [Saprospiraceae bacterium]